MINEKPVSGVNVYIHIPFCKRKCRYCSFVSYACNEDGYIDALVKEIKHFYRDEKANTLYFGGGTPSLLEIGSFKKVKECFNLSDSAEITVEINPESTTEKFLKGLYDLGVSRLSIGVQSFNDEILKNIGRLHNSKQAKQALTLARNTGFKNMSIDLIYGLPGQTLKDWENTLEEALELNTEHISLYGLKIEEGSYFYDNPPENIADSDTQADMYLAALDKLQKYEHYEISNYARTKDTRSRHNTGYWNLVPYYGFGVSASGYLNKKRYTNTFGLKEYLVNPCAEKLYEETNPLEEEIFLGFRRTTGIDIRYINKEYGIDFEKQYKKTLEKYREHIIKTKNGYRLSVEGILLSNIVLSDFL